MDDGVEGEEITASFADRSPGLVLRTYTTRKFPPQLFRCSEVLSAPTAMVAYVEETLLLSGRRWYTARPAGPTGRRGLGGAETRNLR